MSTNDVNYAQMDKQQLQDRIRVLRQRLTQAENVLSAKTGITSQSNLSQQQLNQFQGDMMQQANNQTRQLQFMTRNTQQKINEQRGELDMLEEELERKEIRSEQQMAEIDNKLKLIETRNRMYQLSQEKNVYKKKIIMTLISLIIMTLILMMVSYTYFNRSA